MSCLASFFDAMSGVKKLAYFHVGHELLASIVLHSPPSLAMRLGEASPGRCGLSQ